jgi:hypothetical protein
MEVSCKIIEADPTNHHRINQVKEMRPVRIAIMIQIQWISALISKSFVGGEFYGK